VVVLKGKETLLDTFVPFRTIREGPDGIAFVGEFEIAREKLLVRGAVTLENLNDDMKGHPKLEVSVARGEGEEAHRRVPDRDEGDRPRRSEGDVGERDRGDERRHASCGRASPQALNPAWIRASAAIARCSTSQSWRSRPCTNQGVQVSR